MPDHKATLLIIDDDPVIRKLLSRTLSDEGYHCLEASGAVQAMDYLSQHPVDLVIMDIRMPGKTGIELLSEVKTTHPDISVIMATAINETSTAIQCIKQGADDYICKPFTIDEIIASVNRSLEKRRLRLQIREYQQHLEEKVAEQTQKIRQLFLGAIEALVYALETKDKYTAGHSRRVADLAVGIGKEIGLSDSDIEDLRWASLLHDIGKIAVDQLIQNKPGKLTDAEYEHVMTHAHVGAVIVKSIVNGNVSEMIEHHHDHYDGSGLHQCIDGEDIPLGARIIAVADAFDAITSDRPYRSGIPADKAIIEITHCTGTQFDPYVVQAFLKVKH